MDDGIPRWPLGWQGCVCNASSKTDLEVSDCCVEAQIELEKTGPIPNNGGSCVREKLIKSWSKLVNVVVHRQV